MEAIKDSINNALEKLHISGGAAQGAPAKEPSEEQLNELKSKYEKAGQEQVFVSTIMASVALETILKALQVPPGQQELLTTASKC